MSNVGIGTTAPQGALLHVHNPLSNAETVVRVTNASTGSETTDGLVIGLNSGNQAVITMRENADLVLGTNGTNRVWIASNGNVGVGTNIPKATLDIQRNARTGTHNPSSVCPLYVTGDIGEANNGIEFRHTNASQGLGFGYNTIYACGTDQHINILPNGNGNVSIGRSSPTIKFDVLANVSNWMGRFTNDANGANAHMAHGGGYGMHINAGNNASSGTYALEVYSAGASRLFVRGDGLVGVGTTSPSYKLHVAGDVYANGGWFRVSGDAGLYSETHGSHLYPNLDQYGNWKIHGNARGGWNGLHFSDSGVSLMANSTACGFHRNGDGWRLYVENNSLYVRGDITAYWSDRRLKEDLHLVQDWETILEGLTAYRFKWNEKGRQMLDKPHDFVDIGLIAQDVQAVLPQAVKVNKAGVSPSDINVEEYFTIDYDKLTPVCIQALKAHNKMIKDLSDRVGVLENMLQNKELFQY